MKNLLINLVAAVSLLPSLALASEFKIGNIVVGNVTAFETAPMVMTGAGYFTITNTGEIVERLIDVQGDFPRIMLHQSVENDGVVSMPHVDAFEIAPGEILIFEPGANHVMFMGLRDRPFTAGDEIPATLIFENAGELAVLFKVEPR